MVALLSGARRAGVVPLSVNDLHTMAYFADALAPVWELRILDAQRLKRAVDLFSPVVQTEVDCLVGSGMVVPTDVRYAQDTEGRWRLSANYQLNREFARPVLEQLRGFPEQAEELAFVEEVVLAVAALGSEHLRRLVAADASHGNAEVAVGRVLDMSESDDGLNLSARAALRFGSLTPEAIRLSPSEMIHLYLRELDRRAQNAA